MSGSQNLIPDVSEFNTANIGNYANQISVNQELQAEMLNELQEKNQVLEHKKMIQLNQLREIQEKEKLLLTRSRMLQIAQDRNSYKKKNDLFINCFNFWYIYFNISCLCYVY